MTEATPPPESAPSRTANARATVEDASTIAEDLLERGAPWSTKTSWTIVLVEGIVAGVIGLLFLFRPLGGTSTTLQLSGLILLAGALITSFQLWRHHIRPDLQQLAAFRAGSGVTVGFVVVAATFFAAVTSEVSAALAVVVGIGFVVYGLTGIAASFVRSTHDAPLPVASLVLNAILALAGLVLMFSGAAGPDAVSGIYNLLGIALIVAGLGLAGYAYLLRQQEMSGVRR